MDLIAAIILILLFFQLQFSFYRKHWERNLSVHFSFSKTEVPFHSSVSLIEEIHNNKWLPLPALHVKFKTHQSFLFDNEENHTGNEFYYRDDLFTLFIHEKLTRTLPFTCTKRGCFPLTDADLITNDLFFRRSLIKRIDADAMLMVYPKELPVSSLPESFRQHLGDFITKKYYLEDPFLFSGLREYTPFDEYKKINHKISARQQKLYVNTYESTAREQVLIALNVTPFYIQQSELLIERCISLSYSIALYYMEKGIPVGFVTNGMDFFHNQPSFLSYGETKEHLHSLRLALTRIDLHQKAAAFLPLFMNQAWDTDFSSNHIILLSNDRTDQLQKNYMQLYHKTRKITWILPEYKDIPVSSLSSLPNLIKYEVNKYDN